MSILYLIYLAVSEWFLSIEQELVIAGAIGLPFPDEDEQPRATKSRHTERIMCPECGREQNAEVENLECWPYFSTMIHDCENCGYTIMESEWITVESESKP